MISLKLIPPNARDARDDMFNHIQTTQVPIRISQTILTVQLTLGIHPSFTYQSWYS